MSALFTTEFPDFAPDSLPALPEGFVDISWHNDACPSFASDTLGLCVFIDFADPAQREFPETPRFTVFDWDAENGYDTKQTVDLNTDNWAEVMALVAARTEEIKSTSAFAIDWAKDWSSLSVTPVDYGNGRAMWITRRRLDPFAVGLASVPVALVDQITIGL